VADTSYTFHPSDYLRDTVGLSLLEHGAFRLILDHYYATSGILPADKPRLYRICGAFDDTERGAVDTVVEKFFVTKNGHLRNKRADEEIQRKKDYVEEQSRKGKQGGRPEKKLRVSKKGIARVDSVESTEELNALKSLNKDLKELINIYSEKFEKIFNEKPTINYRKDIILFRRLMKIYDKGKIVDLMDKFFDSDDEFILRTGFTVGVFYTSINKLLITGKSRSKPCGFPGCTSAGNHIARGGARYCKAHTPL
jgi:uncharacterized protein YdaU (DUF1376 family)